MKSGRFWKFLLGKNENIGRVKFVLNNGICIYDSSQFVSNLQLTQESKLFRLEKGAYLINVF